MKKKKASPGRMWYSRIASAERRVGWPRRNAAGSEMIRRLSLPFAACLALAGPAAAQDALHRNLDGFRAPAGDAPDGDAPLFSIAREVEARDFEGVLAREALNASVGIKITPIEGLDLRADAWRREIASAPAVTLSADGPPAGRPQFRMGDAAVGGFSLDDPLVGDRLSASGLDLDASYAWDTGRLGRFTLSTRASYVREFENQGLLPELMDDAARRERLVSPELRSSLMLSWSLGNHSASAVTNYFDSFKDIDELDKLDKLDAEALNTLVDNIATVDLQYGYRMRTGPGDRAIISFGVRNIFNEKTARILSSSARILDRNGRTAYGSIKYQF